MIAAAKTLANTYNFKTVNLVQLHIIASSYPCLANIDTKGCYLHDGLNE